MQVVVTGVGLVSPYGVSVDTAIEGLSQARVCAAEREVAGVRAMVASVPPLPPELEALRLDRRPAEAFLIAALEQALERAAKPRAFYFGTCSGEMQRFETWMAQFQNETGAFYEAPAARLARQFELDDPLVFTSACTSALTAFAAAFDAVASGEVESALAAGSDATCAFATSGFLTLKAASMQVCRPFSRTRGGLNFGEGAVAVVLESERSALARGAEILARIQGVGLSGDAKHVTAPRQDGVGLELAIRAALGPWSSESLDVYVAHGTGTHANDAMELALGARLGLLGKPWLAHKAFTGHAMGASGLISFVLANEQMRRGLDVCMPYEDIEAGVRLNASLKGCKRAVASAAAFGGANAAVAWEIA
jgi:3-oxoacyl-(acyl-carrier-protein) synthase